MSRSRWYKKHWQRKDRYDYRSPNIHKPSNPPSGKPTLYYCPLCNKRSLFWNTYDKRYECLNRDCRAAGPTIDALSAQKKQPKVIIASSFLGNFSASANRVSRAFRKQLSRSLAPFRVKRAFKMLWNGLKRILVLVVILAATAIVVAAVCRIISGSAKMSVGIVFTIVGISLLAWGVKSVNLHRLSFARTFMLMLILGLFVLSSSVYLDVRSPVDIKDSVIAALRADSEEFHTSVDAVVGRAELKFIEMVSSSDDEAEKEIDETTKKPKDTENVYIKGAVLIGADGHRITLRNNQNAKKPTWGELKTFLAKDKTDERPYNFSTFVCADFAEMLHNNAEAAGIKAAYVCIRLGPCSYSPSEGGHCFNAFETTDQGLIYIDCTGSSGFNPGNCDKIVDVSVGKHYIPRSIFPKPNWEIRWGDMGVVENIEITQW